ncbi:MAG TPA: CheR family methyltransferase [Solirubrobacteraceae bacterium]|nr:CheR family methyltransferase [Solirubrobacteraceae bacterium]
MNVAPALLDQVQTLLARGAGVLLDGPGRQRLARALDSEATRQDISVADLASRLAEDDHAREAILADISVHETSWFRDPSLWTVLAQDVLPELLSESPGPFVAWSAGAAFGQEAYSLAILLEEAGASDYRVVASDVSALAVRRITAARYLGRELRGLSPERRDRWLEPLGGDTHQIVRPLRARVTAVRQNIVTAPPPLAAGSCGLVLCRYLMIYLTPAAAGGLLGRIHDLLTPRGRLALGASETLAHLDTSLRPQAHGTTFLYPRVAPAGAAHRSAGPPPAATLTPRRPPPGPSWRAQAGPSADPRPGRTRSGLSPASTAGPGASVDAAEVARLLEVGERAFSAGDLGAAATAFRAAAYLRPGSPIPHLQLGLALEAVGDPGAERAFRAAWDALAGADLGDLRDPLGGYRAEELVHLLAAKLSPGR